MALDPLTFSMVVCFKGIGLSKSSLVPKKPAITVENAKKNKLQLE
jgi:hypothetical protein